VRVAPLDRELLRYLLLAAPLMVGVTLLTMDEWYDRWFGGVLGEGTIALVVYARRLMQAPVSVVGQTTATAALPVLSRLVTEARSEELSRLVLRTLQVATGFGVVAGAATFALADPFVAIVYRHGAFGEGDARAVADTLRIFSLAVPAWIAQTIAVRPFYARNDFWRPMLLGTASRSRPLYLCWVRPSGLGVWPARLAITAMRWRRSSAPAPRAPHRSSRLVACGRPNSSAAVAALLPALARR
jgi:putative peptidoglycan lipid II flippase